MNMQEARKRVWENIYALVDVNVAAGCGDLWEGLENLDENDLDRVVSAFEEALAVLGRKSSGKP